jgi:RNA-directed DNA polymerase
MSFLPVISQDALNKISREVRSWGLHRRVGSIFAQLARRINPIIAGWMRYYGAFTRSALYPLLGRINAYLMRWVRCKYRRLKTLKKAYRAYTGITRAYPRLFAHWQWVSSAWRTR